MHNINPDNIKDKGFDKHPENIGAGRKKGVKNRSTILKKWIEITAKIKHPETDEELKGTIEDKIKLALITKALTGDVQAIKEIDDTLYGKIPDSSKVNISGTVALPITGINYIIPDGTDSKANG